MHLASEAGAPQARDAPDAVIQVEAERERSAERREQRFHEMSTEDRRANLGRPVSQVGKEAEALLALLNIRG